MGPGLGDPGAGPEERRVAEDQLGGHEAPGDQGALAVEVGEDQVEQRGPAGPRPLQAGPLGRVEDQGDRVERPRATDGCGRRRPRCRWRPRCGAAGPARRAGTPGPRRRSRPAPRPPGSTGRRTVPSAVPELVARPGGRDVGRPPGTAAAGTVVRWAEVGPPVPRWSPGWRPPAPSRRSWAGSTCRRPAGGSRPGPPARRRGTRSARRRVSRATEADATTMEAFWQASWARSEWGSAFSWARASVRQAPTARGKRSSWSRKRRVEPPWGRAGMARRKGW